MFIGWTTRCRVYTPENCQITSPGTTDAKVNGRTNQPLSMVVGDQDVTGIEIVVVPAVTVAGNIVVEGNGARPRVQLVSVDAPPEPIKVVLAVEGNPWVKVSGRVTNLGLNRTLVLTGPNVDQIQVTVNPDGAFEIPQALPGTYQIRPNPASALTTPSLVSPLISVVIPNQD